MSSSNNPTFFIKGGDNAFSDRQKSIFDQLVLVDQEKKLNDTQDILDIDEEPTPPDETVSGLTGAMARRKRRETKPFRGKESIFKRPEAPPPRFKSRNIPDYQRHPDKWIKYSLADVSKDDMSERSNTAAAMSFLEELASRKKSETDEDEKDFTKIQFKPRKSTENSSTSQISDADISKEKGTFRSSKLVMPEYVVGKGKKKDLKRANKSANTEDKKSKEIKLSHLDDEDDD